MKTTLQLLLVSSLLFTISTIPFLVAADDTFVSVLDTAGEKLHRGINYYILPALSGNGGGLTLASVRTPRCPLDIVQDPNEAKNGLPVTFSPANTKENVVRVSTDLNIKFSVSTICVQSTVWKFDANGQSEGGPYFVTIGGVEGNPGRETITNWFKIQKYEEGYNLLYCPSVCDTCRVICRDIGIVVDNGKRRLALSDEPFKVMFKKA